MMKPSNLDETNPGVAHAAIDLVQHITGAVCNAVNNAPSNNLPDRIYIAAMGMIGAMHVVAALVGPDETPLNERVNKVTTLFAALLAHNVSPAVPADGQTVSNFGPDIVVQALEMVEKQLGHSPDEWLNAKMCHDCRDVAANTKVDRSLRDSILSKHLN